MSDFFRIAISVKITFGYRQSDTNRTLRLYIDGTFPMLRVWESPMVGAWESPMVREWESPMVGAWENSKYLLNRELYAHGTILSL